MGNTQTLVKELIGRLEKTGIYVLLGGGWAEEILGIQEPRTHGDIDLYLPADSFSDLDNFIEENELKLFKNKPHKRAFTYNDVPVEVILIKSDDDGYFTKYEKHSDVIASKVIRWPKNLSITSSEGIKCLSVEALKFKHDMHPEIFPRAGEGH